MVNNAIDKRRAQWLRRIGVGILVLGIVVGWVVYRTGLREQEFRDDPAMIGFDRAEVRQMGVLFGKQGAMIHELHVTLERPKTQATIIFVVAVILAGGCWYFARLFDCGGESARLGSSSMPQETNDSVGSSPERR